MHGFKLPVYDKYITPMDNVENTMEFYKSLGDVSAMALDLVKRPLASSTDKKLLMNKQRFFSNSIKIF